LPLPSSDMTSSIYPTENPISKWLTVLCPNSGLFDNALADYLWSRAILLVGPTIATVGLQLQVPVSMMLDPLVHEKGWWSKWNSCLLEVCGAIVILSGFFALEVASEKSG
jgi:drug/metabolite transporter (DMT)-like permease